MNAKNIILIVIWITFLSVSGYAQPDYFVCFFGEKTNVSSIQIGHAFIGIGKGIPLTCDLNGEETEMVGFYPKIRIEGGKSFWFGPVDGAIKNDIKTKIDSYTFRKINIADYIKIKGKIDVWKSKKYELTRQDCISFFIDIANLIPGLVLPDRSRFITPDDYVKEFIIQNSK